MSGYGIVSQAVRTHVDDQKNLLLYSYLRLLRNIRSKVWDVHTMRVGMILVVRPYVPIYIYIYSILHILTIVFPDTRNVHFFNLNL